MRTNRPRTEPLEILTFNDHVDKHELKRKLRNRKVVGKPVESGRGWTTVLNVAKKSSKTTTGLTKYFIIEYSFRLRRILLMKERKREEGMKGEK